MTPRIPIEEYRERVLAGVGALPPAVLPLRDAFGCVLAVEITAPRDLPPFRSSAMDGFALRSADTRAASAESPVALKPAGEVRMGFPPAMSLRPGQAVAVATGGMVPDGADAVVPFELCREAGDAVVVTEPLPAGCNVRPSGEDLRRGQVLVPAGRRLQAGDLGALAAGGYAEVPVVPPVRVAILSTGDELVDPGKEPASGQIYESNSFMLHGQILQAGAIPIYAGRVRDDPEEFLAALSSAPEADVFVCSGGVSAGPNDPVRRAFSRIRSVSCVQVAVQPGRPQAFGTWLGRPFFGLPGNPMAALVGFELFVRPALDKMRGLRPQVRYLTAYLEGSLEPSRDCPRYFPVQLAHTPDGVAASASGRRRSNQLAALAGADGLVEVPTGLPLDSGDVCQVLPLREGWPEANRGKDRL